MVSKERAIEQVKSLCECCGLKSVTLVRTESDPRELDVLIFTGTLSDDRRYRVCGRTFLPGSAVENVPELILSTVDHVHVTKAVRMDFTPSCSPEKKAEEEESLSSVAVWFPDFPYTTRHFKHETWDETSQLFRDMLQSVAFLHSQGWIHNSLKQDRFLIKFDLKGLYETSLLSHFVYATWFEREHDSYLELFDVLAPEDEHSFASDVYSLGIVFLGILFRGTHLSDDAEILAFYKDPRSTILRFMIEHKVDLPEDMVSLMTRMVDSNPAMRPTCQESLNILKKMMGQGDKKSDVLHETKKNPQKVIDSVLWKRYAVRCLTFLEENFGDLTCNCLFTAVHFVYQYLQAAVQEEKRVDPDLVSAACMLAVRIFSPRPVINVSEYVETWQHVLLQRVHLRPISVPCSSLQLAQQVWKIHCSAPDYSLWIVEFFHQNSLGRCKVTVCDLFLGI